MRADPPPPEPAPDPPLAGALTAFARQGSVSQVDEVWIFAPRSGSARQSGLAVLALFAPERTGDQRWVCTVEYELTRPRGGPRREDRVINLGSAPAGRVRHLIRGVLGRLDDEPAAPGVYRIGGAADRWQALLQRLDPGRLTAAVENDYR